MAQRRNRRAAIEDRWPTVRFGKGRRWMNEITAIFTEKSFGSCCFGLSWPKVEEREMAMRMYGTDYCGMFEW